MKTISIHGIDGNLNGRLKEEAQSLGLSINRTVKNLLEKSLGLSKMEKNEGVFDRFCGVWSKKEHRDFLKRTEDSENIDSVDWK